MKQNISFINFSKIWLAEKRSYIKESSWLLYKYNIEKFLIPTIGNLKMLQINNEKLQQIISEMVKNDFSNNFIKNLISILKSILYSAMNHELIPERHLSVHLTYLNNPKKRIATPSFNTIKKIFQTTSFDTCVSLGISICMNTGIRIGELCALQWKDVDMDNEILNIRKTIQRIRYGKNATKITITTPKTLTSIRDIPLSNELFIKLKNTRPNDKDLFVLSLKNKPMEPRSFRRKYTVFLKENGIPHMKVHMLRHIFATNCIKLGVDYKTLSEILGHASIKTTMDLYVHPGIEEKRKCVEKISHMYRDS